MWEQVFCYNLEEILEYPFSDSVTNQEINNFLQGHVILQAVISLLCIV